MCPVALVYSAAVTFLSFQLSCFHTEAFGAFGSAEGTSSGLMGEWDSACPGQQERANSQLGIGLWGTPEHYSTKLYLNTSVYRIGRESEGLKFQNLKF